MLVKFVKFSGVGAIVTATSMSLNLFFLKVLGTPLYVTYVSFYMISLSVSYWLNSRYTFKVSMSFSKTVLYFAVYLCGMGIGLILLRLYKTYVPLENWILVFLVLPFTMAWNFSMASLVTKDRPSAEEVIK